MYFHASDLDYSNMAIYYTRLVDGQYQPAKKVMFENLDALGYCTPYLSATGEYLFFAAIGESIDLYVCKKENDNRWSDPTLLSAAINTKGQGNPYLTPDSKYLFFAAEGESQQSWHVNWVSTSAFLE